ncbi:MAG TPA: ferrous iron transport protein B, partial [Chloroflexota bacterium]
MNAAPAHAIERSLGSPPILSLVGVPNCGKTALFNRLTGSRQKVANYPGVTVERKEGRFVGPLTGRTFRLIDLPGAYSLEPTSLDEAIARDVVLGRHASEPAPDLLVCVVDATNLRLNLRLVLDLKRTGRPMLVALNMSDVAKQRGYRLDREALERALGMPVIETVAIRSGGERALLEAIDGYDWAGAAAVVPAASSGALATGPAVSSGVAASSTAAEIEATQREVRRILDLIGYRVPARLAVLARLDSIVLNPVSGPLLLAAVLFLMFQAVFSWAKVPMDLIQGGVAALSDWVGSNMHPGPLRGLLMSGILAGAGSVLVFLPQILILFLFILALEDSGYLPRAAYMLDRLMGKVGLSGRAFIPLLSSFACAIPGIMATRTIPSTRDRLATIMIAPLMTCSARLPVYALLIGAFIPARTVGILNLRGLVLFTLYCAGVLSAMAVAFVLKKTVMRAGYQPLLLELPEYRLPVLRNLLLGLWERARTFLSRVATIILSLMVVLWFLASFPAPPPGATGP